MIGNETYKNIQDSLTHSQDSLLTELSKYNIQNGWKLPAIVFITFYILYISKFPFSAANREHFIAWYYVSTFYLFYGSRKIPIYVKFYIYIMAKITTTWNYFSK